MLQDTVPETANPTPDEVQSAYADRLAAVVDEHGVETVAEESGLDESTVAQFSDGEVGDATLSDAAAVFAVDGHDAAAVTSEIRDDLMMGLSTAILDVDTVAVEIDSDLDGKDVRQALEGQIRLRLDELAEIQALIRSRSR
ncbi:MAG: DUF5791 family protein [Halobaculum sp.]|jgi:hypothetical protein